VDLTPISFPVPCLPYTAKMAVLNQPATWLLVRADA